MMIRKAKVIRFICIATLAGAAGGCEVFQKSEPKEDGEKKRHPDYTSPA